MKKPIFDKFKSKSEDFVKKVNSLDFSSLDDAGLKKALKNDIINRAAAGKEIIKRITGLTLFDSQIKTAYGIYLGNICELATGEGKTLAAVLAAIMYYFDNRKISILVFNDYLALRDAADNKEIFDFCGISSGVITASSSLEERKIIYGYDVFYASAKEVGFDFIKNILATNKEEYLNIPFDVAIVDEADSILIDEAGIPLVLAGNADEEVDLSLAAHTAVLSLSNEDYEIDFQENQVWLKDSGVAKIENELSLSNLYLKENIASLVAVNAALEANFLLLKDKDYIIKNNVIKIIDESTGRVAANRRFPDELQRAVEVKESISKDINTQIYNTITMQSFIENYNTLSGMTGTAKTSAKELHSMYGINTVVIEPHVPCIRNDLPDCIYETTRQKRQAVLKALNEAYNNSRPVLLGTSSVAESEWYSKNLDIPHEVLNARNDEREAEIIADAGLPGRITISTNMAGRGVDIKLGGKDQAYKEEVLSKGGLLVISSGINRSRRIDNQLRGRCARQGDKGESVFYISLQDELIAPFIEKDSTEKFNKYVRDAQKVIEGNQAEARYMLHKYSLIIEQQRKVISKLHKELLFSNEYVGFLKTQKEDVFEKLVEKYGEEAVIKAEKQLLVYYLVKCFADYLDTMENIKNGIHLVVVGGKNPLDEFNKLAIANFKEMQSDVKLKVEQSITTLPITENGIDAAAFGLNGTATTWTYVIDESTNQFSRLPEILKMFSNKVKKTKFSFLKLFSDED